jgi:potassium/hydrogen antiporter
MKWNEKAFISWVGLRGAVPIVFATYPLIAGIEKSGMIFNIVFFIVVTSVLLQGTTLKLVARLLGVVAPQNEVKPYPLDIEMSEDSRSELIEVELDGNSIAVGKKLMDLGFPKGSLIVTLNKGSDYLTPIGSTVLEKGDKMLILANTKDDIPEILLCLGGVLRNYNN